MWMVLLGGNWHPADDVVISTWIRTGVVGPDTQVRHATWPSAGRLDGVQAFAAILRERRAVASTVVARDVVPPSLLSPRIKRVLGVLVAAVLATALVGLVARRNAPVGVVAVLLGGGIVVAMLVGRFVERSPVAMQSAGLAMWRRKWTTALCVAPLLLGGITGLNDRSRRATACRERSSAAHQAKRDGRPAKEIAAGFSAAVEACERADDSGAARVALTEQRAAESQQRADEEAARVAKFEAAVAEARRMAAAPGDASAAVAAFAKAEKLGKLSASDSSAYARQLFAKGQEMLTAKDYASAVSILEAARERDGTLAGLDDLVSSAREQAHDVEVTAAIDRATDVASSEECHVADSVASAWDGIKSIEKTDRNYKRARSAASRLEKCRKAALSYMTKSLREVMKSRRENIANEYEQRLLSQGMDVRVRLRGQYKDKLTITYVLFDRAWAYRITDGGSMAEGAFLRSLQDIGFKKVTFSDGFYESYSYDLEPDDERDVMARTTGLGEPFKL
jgi:tetratricopeptide (TPR) repeat protein